MRECILSMGRGSGLEKVNVSGSVVLARVHGVPSGVKTMLLPRRRSMHALAASGERKRYASSGVMSSIVAMDLAEAGMTLKAEAAAPKSVSQLGLKR